MSLKIYVVDGFFFFFWGGGVRKNNIIQVVNDVFNSPRLCSDIF